MSIRETFIVSNQLEEIPLLAEKISAFGLAQTIDPKVIFQVNLVVDELLTNVISYGYPHNETHQIEITLELQDQQLMVTIVDDGAPFNPILEAPQVQLDASVEERKVGGLGLYFAHSMMDALEYHREDGRNRLQLTKQL
jgi:serine/threonine-protein kinase RsbW